MASFRSHTLVPRGSATGSLLLWAVRPPPYRATSEPPPFRPPASPSPDFLEQRLGSCCLTTQWTGDDLSSPVSYCCLFTVPKQTGGFRPGLDLSALNVFLAKKRFRLENPRSFRESLQTRDWVTFLNLTDVYSHPDPPSRPIWLR